MKTLLIDIQKEHGKLAFLDGTRLIEVIYTKEDSIIGNIYKAKVVNVGKEFAFLDIGTGKNGFLQLKNNQNLKYGDSLIVQVKKDSIDGKGPTLVQDINFVGKYIILLKSPFKNGVFVSDKIDKSKKDYFFNLANELCPNNFSLVIRTECVSAKKEEIQCEIEELIKKAEKILHEKFLDFGLMYNEDENIFYKSSLLSLLSCGIERIITNSKDEFENIKEIAEVYNILPVLMEKDIFEEYEINHKLKELNNKKIWLKSGGYIIIEKTSALTVIDVNTGKSNNKKKDNIQKTNIEACEEIAYQIRLRNITGIIIIDFINMNNMEILLDIFKKYISKDRQKVIVVGISKLGLMEITRRRV